MAKISCRVDLEMNEAGLSLDISYYGSRSVDLESLSGVVSEVSCSDVTCVGDGAFPLVAKAKVLEQKTCTAVVIVVSVFRAHGLQLNFNWGKMEVVVKLVSSNA